MRLLKRLGLIAALAVIVVACNVLKYDEVVTNRTIEFKVSTAYDDVLFEASFLDEGTFSKGLRRTGSIPKLIQGIDFNLKNSQDSIVYQAVFVGDTDSIEGAHLWRDSTDYGNKFEFLVKDTNGTVLEEVTFIAKNKFQNCDFYTKGGEPTEAQTIELNLTDDTGKQTYSVRASNNRKLKAVSINDTKEPLVGHRYKFDIKDLNDSIIFLARYFGDNKYIKDTIPVNEDGTFVIEGKEDLECGIYLIVRQARNTYFEFLVSDQGFEMTGDTSDFIKGSKFYGSPDNEKLYEYFKYTGEKGEMLQDTSLSKDEKTKIHKEINAYKKKFIEENPANPMSVLFLVQEDVDLPQELKDMKGDSADRIRYYYYLNHYWDKVDFNSECLLRTPVFHGKLQRYFDRWVPQHYDSVPKYAIKVAEMAKANPEVFKYVVNYLTFKWESGKEKRMCWDKVFYNMAKTYYVTEPETQTPWVDEGQMAKIRTRVDDLEHCLCGEKAVRPQMTYQGRNYGAVGMDDTLMRRVDLYSVPADYVIMWFWDSDCGHCKKQTPKLWDLYQKYKKQGKSLEVYAINIEQETPGYMKYLREKKYSWINVQDTAHLTKFRDYYDIFSTPVSFILDKERKIIGKRIDPPAIDNFLEQVFLNEEEEKKKKSGK